jgi:hypothetical protein
MTKIDSMCDAYLGLKFRIAYEKYWKIYNEHAEHDCQENECRKYDTDSIQIIVHTLNEIVGVNR